MINDKFNIIMPAEIQKSENGEWKIAGLASTQNIDQQGESIIQKGIDLTPIDEQKGYFNFDHGKGPANLIGLIDGYSQGTKGLYVHGRLFKDHDKAKSVYQIMSSLGKSDSGRVGMSVEGSIIERDPNDPKIIKKCKINKVAITFNPVNTQTYADLVKSMGDGANIEFDSTKENNISIGEALSENSATFTTDQVVAIVQKALGMGPEGSYSKAPNELTNGDAMATSDMKPNKKKDKKKKESDADQDAGLANIVAKALKPMSAPLYKSMMLTMLDKLQVLHPDISRSEIWEAVQERLNTQFPDIHTAQEEK